MTRRPAIPRPRPLFRLALLLLGPGWVLSGCASAPSGTPAGAELGAAAYPAVFDAARETLAEFRFTLDRVDAARGVITTEPKRTAGLLTPWDAEQSSAGTMSADLMNQHERVVRVTFDPPEAPTRVWVEVVVHRVHRPNWRVETDSIRHSTHARDPLGIRAGQPPEFREPVSEDRALAARLLARIRERAGLDASVGDPGV